MPETLPYLQNMVPDQGQAFDEDFFTGLLKSHLSHLTYFTYQIVADTAIAEEIASETFVKLWTNQEKLLKVSAVKAFLYSTAKNAAIDYIRRAKVARQRSHDLQIQLEITDQSIEEALIKTEVISDLYKALQSLPVQYQNVVKLEYLEGKSIKEIAATMNISVNTVKTYRKRGIQKLKKWLSAILVCNLMLIFFL
jgi:RNA polymerase sigma-70 factor (family 1)